ncbi:MAG: hypothetical protein ACK41C_03480 [Phenylobacterium sp.]|uniref:hypothetical protein n=1 Tax=Phenylobacterium sp. TaxID=1871053 RepID=UPI00391CF384
MADEPRTPAADTVAANRARMQGSGVGQSEMDAQRDPNRFQSATAPERNEAFDTQAAFDQSGDRPAAATFEEADSSSADDGQSETGGEKRSFDTAPDPRLIGTPANLDLHDVEARGDSPQLDWGDPEPEAQHGQTHTRRPAKTEADRGQGPKTRMRNKQIVSGRPYG